METSYIIEWLDNGITIEVDTWKEAAIYGDSDMYGETERLIGKHIWRDISECSNESMKVRVTMNVEPIE